MDKDDARWNHFKTWNDADQDGKVDEGELETLKEAGIESFNLSSDGEQRTLDDGTIVFGEGRFTYEDGTFGKVSGSAQASVIQYGVFFSKKMQPFPQLGEARVFPDA